MTAACCGRTRRLLGGCVAAPSTLGTFLRAFTFGHVRQLDRLLGEALTRAWQAGTGPGDGRLVIDVDSFVGEVSGRLKRGAAYGYTKLFGYHPILATRADMREALHMRLTKGSANTQKGMLRFCDERSRVNRAGAAGVKLLRADLGFWNTGETSADRVERRAGRMSGWALDDRWRERGRRYREGVVRPVVAFRLLARGLDDKDGLLCDQHLRALHRGGHR